MFAQTWRKHWGLAEDPFVHEDADKDPVLARIDVGAVHSAFDRIYGNPATPGPGIVFGEKGSGKSGLRLALERRVREHNEANPRERVFVVEYTEFDSFLDQFRQTLRLPPAPEKSVPRLLERFRAADHLDAILSVGVTKLVDEVIDGRTGSRKLARKLKLDLLGLAALYYVSKRRAHDEALAGLRHAVRFGGVHGGFVRALQVSLAVVALAAFVVPHLESLGIGSGAGPAALWYTLGALLLAGDLAWFALARLRRQAAAARAVRAVRVLPRDAGPLVALLESVPPGTARGIALPIEDDETSRYLLLQRFLAILEALGYGCVYVFMDRVDESTVLSGRDEWTRTFVERLLDHKLLQHDGIGFKLFLPIEVSSVYTGATPEQLKRMRMDKANAVQEMRWTGRELFEIANQRLRASSDGEGANLADFFAPDLDVELVRDALHELGTPRHAFGFLAALFSEYARNLPEDLDADASEWRISRSHFEVVRAGWVDRSRVLRRVMN